MSISKNEPDNNQDSNIIFNPIDLKQGSYTTIHNDIINDHNLKMQSRFLMIFLLSKPPSWKIYIKSLAKILKKNKGTIAEYLKELELNGYLIKEKDRTAGKFKGYIYNISSRKLTATLKTGNGKEGLPLKPETENNTPYKDLTNTKERYIEKTDQSVKETDLTAGKKINDWGKGDYDLLTPEGKKIYDLLEETAKTYDFEPINTYKALAISQEYDFSFIEHKIARLKIKIDSGQNMRSPAAYLIQMIENKNEFTEKKQEDQPTEKQKEDLPDQDFYKHFQNKKLITISQRPTDKHFEIIKYFLKRFHWLRKAGDRQEKELFLTEIKELQDFVSNRFINKEVSLFSYPNDFAGPENKKLFIQKWEEVSKL